MSGIYFLISLIAVAIIVVWYIQNDGTKPGEPTKGLLRMQDAANPEVDGNPRPRGARSREPHVKSSG